jgi:hypothetical protein
MSALPFLHVVHATGGFEGVLTLAGLMLSGMALGAAVLALQRACSRSRGGGGSHGRGRI